MRADLQPYVSVIIPVLNGEQTIKECLDSLMRMDYPPDRREILVIDNGSIDRTATITRQYPVRYVLENRRGLSHARNRGIEESNAPILAFIDSDCIATTGWLREIMLGFDSEQVGAVAGEVVSFPPKTLAEHYMAKRKPVWQRRNLNDPVMQWFAAAFAFNRIVYDVIGRYDDQFAGVGCVDIDFSWRFFENNKFRLNYRQKAVVFHRHRLSTRGLFIQYYRYAQGQFILKRKYPQILTWGWRQEIGAYKDLLLTFIALCRAAIHPRKSSTGLSEFSYQYLELARKLSERIGFTYAALRKHGA